MAAKDPEQQLSEIEAVDHSDYLALSSLALDGMLDHQEKGRLDRHLEECNQCRVQWLLWQVIDLKFRVEPAPEPAPDFVHRVANRLARQERMRNVRVGLLLTTLTVFGWSLGLVGASGLVFALMYSNLDRFAATRSFLVDAWAVAGVVGQSLWDVLFDLTATPTALGVASAYLIVAAVALAGWFLVIQRSTQPVKSRLYREWGQSPS